MHRLGQGFRELGIGAWIRSDEVDRSTDGIVSEDPHHGRHMVMKADPRHVLAAVTDLAAQSEPEEWALLAEDAAERAHDVTGTQGCHAHSFGSGIRGRFPPLADLGQESFASGVILVEPFIATRAVIHHSVDVVEEWRGDGQGVEVPPAVGGLDGFVTSQCDDVVAFLAQPLNQRCADETGKPSDGNLHVVILRGGRKAPRRRPPASHRIVVRNCAEMNAGSSRRRHRR